MPFTTCPTCGKPVRQVDQTCWNCASPMDGCPNADVEAEVTLLATDRGGRRSHAATGYRPQHRVLPNYQTSGEHRYIGRSELKPGQTGLATIKFLSPESYPHCLWVGRELEVAEGNRMVGTARITKIFNPLLEKIEGQGSNR